MIRVQRTCLALTLILIAAGCTAPGSPTPTPSPVATASQVATPTADAHREQRETMVARTIEARGVSDPKVLRAMRAVPRHRFVPERYVDQAYEDHPLPIGHGQTISQPYIVAWMTELLELQPGERILEIGTGSGYQAAVLAELEGVEVYTVEIIPELAAEAEARLTALGYTDIHTKSGDGYYGWPEHAPYDATIVTAAPDHLPHPLATQLAEDGRMVIPIGPPGGYQELWKFTKANGELTTKSLGGVMFVPLTGSGH